MAARYKSKGTFASGTGNVSPGIPTDVGYGDLLLLHVESANQPGAAPSGWTAIPTPSGTPSRGTAGSAGGVASEVFYRWWQPGDTAPSVTDRGNHTTAIITAYTGVDPTTPFDGVTPVGFNAAASTTLTMNGITTGTADALVVHSIAIDRDAASTNQVTGSPTNANLTGLAERHDQIVSTAVGGGLAIFDGAKASAGATGDTTATQTSSAYAGTTLSLRSATDPELLHMAGVTDNVGGTGNVVTASFTPPANCRLVAVVQSMRDSSTTSYKASTTVSGGSLSWNQDAAEDDGDWVQCTEIWTAEVGGSPSSMTVTWSSGGLDMYLVHLTVYAVQLDGAAPTVGLAAAGSDASTSGSVSLSLGGTTGADSLIIGAAMATESPASEITVGSSWTEIAETTDGPVNTRAQIQFRKASVSSVPWADVDGTFGRTYAAVEFVPAASGDHEVSAALSLQAAQSAGAADLELRASAALALQPAAFAGHGGQLPLSAALALQPATMAGVADVALRASAALALQAATSAGAVDLKLNTAAALALQAPVMAGAADLTLGVAGAFSLQPATMTGAGGQLPVSAALTLQAAGMAGAVELSLNTAAALALRPAVFAGAVDLTSAVSATLALQPAQAQGQARQENTLAAQLALRPAAMAGTASLALAASAALALGASEGAGAADLRLSVSAALALAASTATASAIASTVSASAALALQAASAQGALTLTIGVDAALSLQPAQALAGAAQDNRASAAFALQAARAAGLSRPTGPPSALRAVAVVIAAREATHERTERSADVAITARAETAVAGERIASVVIAARTATVPALERST